VWRRKRDMVELSPEAAVWMAGFLAGNEPEPEEMFGPGITEAADDDPRMQRWRQVGRVQAHRLVAARKLG
jgi:hypothetical protein